MRWSACLWLGLAACTSPARDSTPWVVLFNGRNLEGWVVKITGRELGDDPLQTFRVEDGLLRVAYDGYEGFDGRFGHLFYQVPFTRYRLRVEYRFLGVQVPGAPDWAWRNSGVMLHSQAPGTMAREQAFPVSLEVQLLGAREGDVRPTANLCTPGTEVEMGGVPVSDHCTDSSSPTCAGDGWVTVEIEVLGGERVRHFVEGALVLEYANPKLDAADPDAARLLEAGAESALERGWIALQAESHPVEFRRVELLPLL
jgi:hypothetical protein